MFILSDNYCNAFVQENGKIVARRTGETVVFKSREEADAALAAFLANNPGRLSPVWVEAL